MRLQILTVLCLVCSLENVSPQSQAVNRPTNAQRNFDPFGIIPLAQHVTQVTRSKPDSKSKRTVQQQTFGSMFPQTAKMGSNKNATTSQKNRSKTTTQQSSSKKPAPDSKEPRPVNKPVSQVPKIPDQGKPQEIRPTQKTARNAPSTEVPSSEEEEVTKGKVEEFEDGLKDTGDSEEVSSEDRSNEKNEERTEPKKEQNVWRIESEKEETSKEDKEEEFQAPANPEITDSPERIDLNSTESPKVKNKNLKQSRDRKEKRRRSSDEELEEISPRRRNRNRGDSRRSNDKLRSSRRRESSRTSRREDRKESRRNKSRSSRRRSRTDITEGVQRRRGTSRRTSNRGESEGPRGRSARLTKEGKTLETPENHCLDYPEQCQNLTKNGEEQGYYTHRITITQKKNEGLNSTTPVQPKHSDYYPQIQTSPTYQQPQQCCQNCHGRHHQCCSCYYFPYCHCQQCQ